MKALWMAAAVTAALGFASPAIADSGSIANVHALADGQVEATYTATSTSCSEFGYCGWFPFATQEPADQICSADSSNLTYVGPLQNGSGTVNASDPFYPLSALPLRLCLWVSGPSGADVLVAEYVYTPPSPTPSPSPSPRPSPIPTAPEPECSDGIDNDGDGGIDFDGDDQCDLPTDDSESGSAVSPMRVSQGRALVNRVLRKEYGRKFTVRSRYRRACWRHSSTKIRCSVKWRHGPWRYAGMVTMRRNADDLSSYLYVARIGRKRVAAPSEPSPAAPPASNCDPNYSGCLDPNASDYDCIGGSGDGPRYTGPIRVIGNDHYDLDRDGDGMACDVS